MQENNTNTYLYPANNKKQDEDFPLPEHLTSLPGGNWALWRWVGLRGAGFPGALVDKLSAPECAAAADRLLQAEEEAQQAQKVAIKLVNAALDAVPYDDKARRDRLARAKKSLIKGKFPEAIENVDTQGAIEAFRNGSLQVEAAWANFRAAFTTDTLNISESIAEIAQDRHFREAVVWQNRRVLHSGIDPLVRMLQGNNSRDAEQRRLEQLVAMYLQRYCVKNDTIGFFGPVGWAKLVDKGLVVEPGANLLESRTASLESWCIDALAETISQNPALRPWFIPRKMPFIHVEGTKLYVPMQETCELSALQGALLRACDGEKTAKRIAAELLESCATVSLSEEQIYQMLEGFCSMGIMAWNLEIPVQPNPEQMLRRQLEQIEDESLRRGAIEILSKFEAARDAIANAVDVEKLEQAIANLEETFTSLTGVSSTRAEGKTYVGRTLVYEDCRRDMKVEIGQEIIDSLGEPLSLLLSSARWFTYQTATLYRQTFKNLYSELVEKTGSPVIDLLTFWQTAQPLLMDEKIRPFEAILPMFQQRWADVLNLTPGQRRVNYTCEELRSRVQTAFDAPNAGWRTARYNSPDVLLNAPSAEAIRQGNYQFVLGELHLAGNPLLTSFFLLQHPSPEELLDCYKRDLPEPFLMPVPDKEWTGMTTRTPLVLVLPKDFYLTVFPDTCGLPKSQVLPIGELVVEDTSNGLVVRTHDRRLQFDIIEAFSEILALLALTSFKMLRLDDRIPRVTIDRFVVQRESWGFIPSEIEFAYEKNETDRFVSARRWARAHGMPRYMFAKTPIEIKPFYVDFDSPVYVDFLAKTIRRTVEANPAKPMMTFTEMLPTKEGFWLPNKEGQLYTSEFRMVAFDLKAFA
jgi:Lantibiotic dehydratase, N terminus